MNSTKIDWTKIDWNNVTFPDTTLGELLATKYDADGSLMAHETEKDAYLVSEYVSRFFINTSSLDFIADKADTWDGDWNQMPLSANQVKAIEASLHPNRPVFSGEVK